jgi:AcrR family transcriptional regulator
MQTRKESTPRPRGRPRAFDREAVMTTASARFRSRGLSATSLDELAEATGVARPSLAAAFGDKRAMYLAALKRTHDWLAESFEQLRVADLPLRDALERMFRFSIRIYLDGEFGPSGCIALNTAVAEAVTDPEVRAPLSNILELEDRAVTRLLEQAGSPTPAAHAQVAVSVLQALSIRARSGRPREELEAVAASCVDLIAPRA